MISLETAHSLILDNLQPLEDETCALVDSVGRVLAADLIAEYTLPGWDNSAMDGFALRLADLQGPEQTLAISDEIAAGDGHERPLKAKTAARIFTGAPMPPGADTVVIQESCTIEEGQVRINKKPQLGSNIRKRGSDLGLGDTYLNRGRVLTAGDISLAASQGRDSLPVHRRASVAILTTGDELIEPKDAPPARGQIIDGNSIALAGCVHTAGGFSHRLGSIIDDPEVIYATLNAQETDIVISTGGASVGKFDHVAGAIKEICQKGFGFNKVAVKPGKPVIFGRRGQQLFFGLPGNPVSALVAFELFVRPALRQLQGYRSLFKTPIQATLDAPLRRGGRRVEYRRGRCWNRAGLRVVRVEEKQSSGALTSIAAQDVLVRVDVGQDALKAGSQIEVLPLNDELGYTEEFKSG